MRTMFPALLGVLVALSLGSVTEANAQTREDEIAIRQAVDTMTEAFKYPQRPVDCQRHHTRRGLRNYYRKMVEGSCSIL